MSFIHVLDEKTINKIAAGEVVERPSAVVKELIENAVDAGSTAITLEIKDGGLSLIRITDNGAGIAKEDIPLAFLRHATSKIRTAEDLLSVTSLGFRGEALSSIAAVSQVELITKNANSLSGSRYLIEGGTEKSLEEIGCPNGTTILVRNIFYNTPARRNFLKSATTEAGYISDLMERLMVSHPSVSFKFIMNNQVKLQSSGNNSSKDILYHVYGRDIAKQLLPVSTDTIDVKITGYIGKPVVTRGNRNYENYFINGRYIKSNIITKAIEEAYKPYLMQHKYPFISLYFEINPNLIDVNVHPQKLEVRLKNSEEIYSLTFNAIKLVLSEKEMIPRVILTEQKEVRGETITLPEPFEENRRKQFVPFVGSKQTTINPLYSSIPMNPAIRYSSSVPSITDVIPKADILSSSDIQSKSDALSGTDMPSSTDTLSSAEMLSSSRIPSDPARLSNENKLPISQDNVTFIREDSNYLVNNATQAPNNTDNSTTNKQISLFSPPEDDQETENTSANAPFISTKAFEDHRIIGQLFSTYWLVEYKKELFIIDQHAAHEKVLYERIMTASKEKTFQSQMLLPPIVLTLSMREQEVLVKFHEDLKKLGYEFEHFGGNEYSVRAVPADLYGISEKNLLLEFIDDLVEDSIHITPSSVVERVASLSCKAAVKANHTLSYEEANTLIKELLTLENPYHCPHGRPIIISMSQYELEKKFKRIL